jgi:hypothetical protein
MSNATLKASVHYGDYKGTAAADHHDQRNLDDLARENGIDSERYFVFGVEFNIGETRREKLGPTSVTLLAVDSEAINAYGAGPVQDYVNGNNGVLPYMKFDIEATLEEVLLTFKRFNVVLTNSRIKNVREYQLTHDEGDLTDGD